MKNNLQNFIQVPVFYEKSGSIKMNLLNPEKIVRAEEYYDNDGNINSRIEYEFGGRSKTIHTILTLEEIRSGTIPPEKARKIATGKTASRISHEKS